MPKVSRESATQGGDYGVVVDRSDEVEGYSINFTTFREDIDATPLMKGLPDDRCQCPHWGYVIAGRVTFRFEDREESFAAGDASSRRRSCSGEHEPGSEVVMFSPAEKLHKTEAVMMRNMQALQGAHA